MSSSPKQPAYSADRAALSSLFTYLSTFHPPGINSAAYIKKQIIEYRLKKGDLLQTSGSICDCVYFVVKGALRGYMIDNNKKVTTWITCENELVSSIRSLVLQIPTQENIEALEDCSLLGLRLTDLQHLYDNYQEWNLIGRKIAEYYYTCAEARAFICRLSNTTERYNYFIANNGQLINRIPLMYIASYLGMTEVNLSRIRSRLAKKKV